jgi:D-3-phosphoglycerate dehydrogenase
MRLLAFDPYVSAERAKHLGVEMRALEDVVAQADFLTIHLPKTPETAGLIGAELLARVKPGVRIVNTARGGIIDEKALAAAVADGLVAGAALDVFEHEPTTESPLFELDAGRGHPAPRRQHPGGSGQGRCDHRRAGAAGSGRRVRAVRGQHRRRRGSRSRAPLAAGGGAAGPLLGGPGPGAPEIVLDIEFQGGLADHDTRILTLAVLKGLFAVATDEPVSYVNAPQLAEERGLVVRSTTAHRRVPVPDTRT